MDRTLIKEAVNNIQSFRLSDHVQSRISLFVDTQLVCAQIQIILDGLRNGNIAYAEARDLMAKVL